MPDIDRIRTEIKDGLELELDAFAQSLLLHPFNLQKLKDMANESIRGFYDGIKLGEDRDCPLCKGTGLGKQEQVMVLHGIPHIMGTVDCPECNGTGKLLAPTIGSIITQHGGTQGE